MGPVLLQEETRVSGENLRCLVESNWTTLFSHETNVTLISIVSIAVDAKSCKLELKLVADLVECWIIVPDVVEWMV